ncbi:S9 family peptidase [Qipengyuania sediminis]|uniref:S9 family peptidase n=1 Tax=Qipengyuania sediminis TaxID=1532023 RepID=UPI00105A60DE|nr:S9 family peptidase [Qipengyuania sediminis]
MHAAALLAAAAPLPLAAQESAPVTPGLTLERVFASPSLSGQAPRGVKLSPDGRWLTVLRPRESDKDRFDLWGYERATGQWRMLVDSEKVGSGRALSEAEKMQRERARIGKLKGIVAYEWAPKGDAILVPLDGDLYLAKLDGSVARLTDTPEGELNPALSEGGRYLSFAREGRVYVGEVGGAAARPITPEGEPEAVSWGVAEFVAQEELNRIKGLWWAPGDNRLAIQRTDETPVGVVTRTAIGADATTVTQQRYPAAGTDNAIVQLFLVDPDGGNRVEVDLGADKDFYLGRVDWARDGRTLYVQRLTRAQDRLDMLAADPATGKTRLLFSERAAEGHWINLTDNYRWLKDGSLVWWSERDGFGHLYRWQRGKWTQLTRGPWQVSYLDGVDEESGRVYFDGFKDGPLAQQSYVTALNRPGQQRRLTDLAFHNDAEMDKAARALMVTRSNGTQPPQTYLADTDGKRLTWIAENRVEGTHPYAPFLPAHRRDEFGMLKAADGQVLHWRMVKPALVPGKRYPVIFWHYGGPHAQTVTRAWSNPLRQALVARGYILFEIDNRGSANRGVAFEKPLYHAMGGVEVADQKVGGDYLKSLPFVDPDKIALYGWSYGGYLTLKQLQADPGYYAAGIAGAPVTKWELYDTAYTERYMGDPRLVPDAYAKASALEEATRIADPLLLIHGMSDDNVVFSNSTALAARLQQGGAPFDMMFYPGETHSVGGPEISPHLWYTILRFLDAHGVTPPK